ncbi:hypothetical protein DNU06_13180 [Putridiphycobacter roseus]|uniref:Outer membrane protein beta-barrel domain-containing protein n=1 Tax=Putridiphycobacter roseus TaxID=2219161 RepID=A0A2W1NBN4_9FLAO|nr:hypothetical protein [Putridiphycobacter roseus]PZE16493.1 hypothetical protein DNU06_13180 [Putridiphycobacter roseus]
MKKIIVICTFIGLAFSLNAQVNPNAIGLRTGGGSYGYGYEISFQHGFGSANRLELDLGSRGNSGYRHLGVSGIYHWVWNITDGLNWYAGPGAQIGLYSYKNIYTENYVGIGIGGQIGIEYDFSSLDVPLLLSLDTRPMWGLNGGYSGLGYGANFALRYLF